ncbi:hypothetical protein V1638_04780 [Pseudarthrobacter sp. J64]|uniref:hypothetical protein n=1 Tax=Pseudarthrobacter sp. J64 TaxID=3116485 RepID=UPI002E81DA79|nr:hypothetical protein [Pseudarthrobacter sp. J64]MEE2568707.1 hypothetical protein [Pseudarthrobacter sp. J64]
MSIYDPEPVEISTRMRPGEWSEETLAHLVAGYQEKIMAMGALAEDVITSIHRDHDGGVSVKVSWDKAEAIEDPLRE